MSRIAAACGQTPAIRAECQTLDKPGRAAQCDGFGGLGRRQVPNFYGRVPTTGGEIATIRAEGRLPNIAAMALERAELCVRLRVPIDVPDFHDMIAHCHVDARRCDAFAIGTNCDAGMRVEIVADFKTEILCVQRPN